MNRAARALLLAVLGIATGAPAMADAPPAAPVAPAGGPDGAAQRVPSRLPVDALQPVPMLLPVNARAEFTVARFGLGAMPGVFRRIDAALAFDPARPEASTLEVTIDAASIDVDDARMNRLLGGPAFFDAARHPSIRFRSTRIDVLGPRTAQVQGELTLRGVTRPMRFDVRLDAGRGAPAEAGDRGAGTLYGFAARGTLRRSEFGMGHLVPWVGDEIVVVLSLQALALQAPAAGNSTSGSVAER